jgi:UDPglucose 6-dehydrogenase
MLEEIIMKITCIGTGYVGLTTGACLANLGHDVLCVDIDEEKIEKLKRGEIPFYEPGLKELVLKNREKGRLNFTTNIEEGIKGSGIFFNCVGTPSKEDGSADLQYVFKVAEEVGKFAKGFSYLVNKSTVPPGTARKCFELIRKVDPDSAVEVVSNPEFLKEGAAVYDFEHPDKIVVGATSERAFNLMKMIYTGRMRTYIPIIETDWETAEMIKYANNSKLAARISFMNETANICDKVGADVKVVSQAIGMDQRIGPKFLNAGAGYGGSCFPKDVRALIATAKDAGYDAKLLKEVDNLNERQKLILSDKIKERFSDLSGKVLTVWGLSFKPKTDDMREAPSIVLINELLDAGAKVNVYDPEAMENAKEIFGNKVVYSNSIEESIVGSEGIVLVTEWSDFRNANLLELGKKMKDRVLFDGRNIYVPEMVKEEGFEYVGIGRK